MNNIKIFYIIYSFSIILYFLQKIDCKYFLDSISEDLMIKPEKDTVLQNNARKNQTGTYMQLCIIYFKIFNVLNKGINRGI